MPKSSHLDINEVITNAKTNTCLPLIMHIGRRFVMVITFRTIVAVIVDLIAIWTTCLQQMISFIL